MATNTKKLKRRTPKPVVITKAEYEALRAKIIHQMAMESNPYR